MKIKFFNNNSFKFCLLTGLTGCSYRDSDFNMMRPKNEESIKRTESVENRGWEKKKKNRIAK